MNAADIAAARRLIDQFNGEGGRHNSNLDLTRNAPEVAHGSTIQVRDWFPPRVHLEPEIGCRFFFEHVVAHAASEWVRQQFAVEIEIETINDSGSFMVKAWVPRSEAESVMKLLSQVAGKNALPVGMIVVELTRGRVL